MRLRALGRAVLQGAAILLISLALSEAVLRVYDYFQPMFIFYDPSYNRFRLRPHSLDWGFKLNSGGFKDENRARLLPRAAGQRGVLSGRRSAISVRGRGCRWSWRSSPTKSS